MEYDFVIADRLGTHKCPDGVFLCPGGKENSLIGHIHSVESMGLVDGPGVRAVVFLQGCPLRCRYCHNPDTQEGSGTVVTAEELTARLLRFRPYFKRGGGVTFSGGEPFCQAEALVPVAEAVKAMHKHLMIYTGYLYEQLLKMEESGVQRLLELADVLVDGPFLLAERNLTLQYRGSENQRVIDLAKTRATGEIILYKSEYDEL